jgi:hypothetical protein
MLDFQDVQKLLDCTPGVGFNAQQCFFLPFTSFRRRRLLHLSRMQTLNIFILEIVTPWEERLVIEIPPPKPDALVCPGRYRWLNQRCAYHDCNRLYAIAERGNKIYCSKECQEKSKQYRRKLKHAPGAIA